MANPTKPCLDLGQVGQERVGAQPNLPSMQNDDGNGASPACHLPLLETRMESVDTWTGEPNLHPNEWPQSTSQLDWWENISTSPTTSRKGTRSLALIIS